MKVEALEKKNSFHIMVTDNLSKYNWEGHVNLSVSDLDDNKNNFESDLEFVRIVSREIICTSLGMGL